MGKTYNIAVIPGDGTGPEVVAEGITVIDGVYNDIADTAGFEAECRQGLEFGFDGKTLIHPSQIEACNAGFAPTEEEVSRARAVIAAAQERGITAE